MEIVFTAETANDSFTLGQLFASVRPSKATITPSTHEVSIPIQVLIRKCISLDLSDMEAGK